MQVLELPGLPTPSKGASLASLVNVLSVGGSAPSFPRRGHPPFHFHSCPYAENLAHRFFFCGGGDWQEVLFLVSIWPQIRGPPHIPSVPPSALDKSAEPGMKGHQATERWLRELVSAISAALGKGSVQAVRQKGKSQAGGWSSWRQRGRGPGSWLRCSQSPLVSREGVRGAGGGANLCKGRGCEGRLSPCPCSLGLRWTPRSWHQESAPTS